MEQDPETRKEALKLTTGTLRSSPEADMGRQARGRPVVVEQRRHLAEILEIVYTDRDRSPHCKLYV